MASTLDDPEKPFPWLSGEKARAALALVEPACRPADRADLYAALVWLAHVTTGDKLRDSNTALASAKALADALSEFPAFAAIGAIKDWPQTEGGKWWPTEHELRREAQFRTARRIALRDELREMGKHGEPRTERKPEPHGGTRAFVDDVESVRGHDHVVSWLTGLNCAFTDDTVFTTSLGAEKLNSLHASLLAKHRVKVRYCADVTRAFYEAMDRRKAAW